MARSTVVCGPHGACPRARNILFHNNGNGTFTDVSEKSGILKPGPHYTITPGRSDFDNDGWPDIYVAVDSMPAMLFHNNHDGTFTDIAFAANCAYNEEGREQAGMGLAWGLQCAMAGWTSSKRISRMIPQCFSKTIGDGTFTDVTFRCRAGRLTRYVGWGAAFMDFDNDGWPDIFYVTGHTYSGIKKDGVDTFNSPRIVLKNMGDGKFTDVSDQLGPGVSARHSSRGSIYGDIDNDGDIDVAVLNMNEPFSVLRNEGGNRNSSITVKLIGTRSNRSAIGARVRITSGGRSQIQEVASGGSVMSQNDLRLQFGLGQSRSVGRLEVRWPGSLKWERFEGLEADRIVTIKEGVGIIRKDSYSRLPSLPAQ